MFFPAPLSLGGVGNSVLWKIRNGEDVLVKAPGRTVGSRKGTHGWHTPPPSQMHEEN